MDKGKKHYRGRPSFRFFASYAALATLLVAAASIVSFRNTASDMREAERQNKGGSPAASGPSLVAYVDGHYGNADLSLDLLEGEFGMSAGTINKLFRQLTGSTFYAYLSGLRLERADVGKQRKDKTDD